MDASWFINFRVVIAIAITIVEQECMNEKYMQCEYYNESHEVARFGSNSFQASEL